MLKTRMVACALILASACASLHSEDKKKHIVIRVASSTQQVNNHPWSYTTPGKATTDCSTYGTVNGTGTTVGNTTDVNGTVNANTDCTTTYRPPQITSGNRVTVANSSWATDISSGDQYLIQCTANWAASKCGSLNEGNYPAEIDGNNMRITGHRGMKEAAVKFHILQFIPGNRALAAAPYLAASSSKWTEDEKYVWGAYNSLPEEDKNYVREFCTANPTERALIPHAKVAAGQPFDQALGCSYWVSAKAKL